MVLAEYAMPSQAELDAYGLYMKETAETYDLSESTNKELAAAYP